MESTIHVTRVGAATVVTLVGDHDLTSTETFHQRAKDAVQNSDELIVDLSAATFVDSMMLSTLVRVRRESEACGVAFATILGENRDVSRTVALVGLTSHLNCRDSLAEVLLEAARRAAARADMAGGPLGPSGERSGEPQSVIVRG